VRYELGFYIPEDDILHSHRSENLKSYTLHEGLEYKTRMLMDYIHRPVSSIEYDVSETGSASVLRWM
jgi:hypothetical protein